MAVSKYVLASPVTIDVSWEQKASEHDSLDLTAFLLNKNGQVSEFSDMVFYGTTEGVEFSDVFFYGITDGVEMKLTCKHHITIETKYTLKKQIKSQCMTINLDNLPMDIKHVVFVVSCEDGKPLDKFNKVKIAFRDKINYEDQYPIEDNGDNVSCVSVGALQRKNEQWILVKEETCYAGGLEKAYEDFVPVKIRNKQYPLAEIKRPYVPSPIPMPVPNPTPQPDPWVDWPKPVPNPTPQPDPWVDWPKPVPNPTPQPDPWVDWPKPVSKPTPQADSWDWPKPKSKPTPQTDSWDWSKPESSD